MLEKVKMALSLKSDSKNAEIEDLISAALSDLGIAGVSADETDPLIVRVVITYCRLNFGSPDDYDRLKKSYDEQKAQLQTATGYTDWRL